MLMLLIILLAVIWLVSWGGPRYYPAYATRHRWYPFWGGTSNILLIALVIILLLWLLGVFRI
jgi:hypothetical protein